MHTYTYVCTHTHTCVCMCVCADVCKPLAPVRRRNKMLFSGVQCVRFLSMKLV